MFSSFLTIVFYIQNVLNAVEVSKRTHETINAIHEKLNGISKFYDLTYKLFDITKSAVIDVLPLIELSVNLSVESFTSSREDVTVLNITV